MTFVRIPFANAGDKTTIPEDVQVDGSVSFTDGFGEDYSKPLSSDPNAKTIGRANFNYLMNLLSAEIQQYQVMGTPWFIEPADNDGSPYSYDKNARVLYDDGSSVDIYESLADSNEELPTNTSWWIKISGIQAKGIFWGGTAGGTANALTLTGTALVDDYFAGMVVSCTINLNNTSGTVTLNYNGLGVKTVKKSNGEALTALAIGDLPLGTLQNFAYNGTDFVLMAPRPYGYGGQVASASTLDLTGVPGDYIEVTGNTTINQILLAQGREMTIWFSGTPTITDGANIICISNANVVVAADDTCKVRGDASGVVRMVDYSRSSGQALVGSPSGNDIQVFTASGTWNKPSGFDPDCTVFIEAWGGGASGSHSASGYNSGSGGGSYWSRWMKLSDLGASETVTVGAGGTGVAYTQGSNGGNSSFGAFLTAYGGTAGTTGNGNLGGAGGSPLGQSARGTRTTVALSQTIFSTQGDGGTSGAVGFHGGLYNGGGGGTGVAGGSFAGGGAMNGGGGGAGGGAVSNGTGGVSLNGGNGGKGQATVVAEADGAVPGGGGGGRYAGPDRPGHGGRGEVRVSVFRKV